MDNTYFSASAVYLIQTLFGLYIFAVLLRLMLQIVRANFYNPISQFLVKITNPPLKPLRRLIPGLWGIDLASIILLIALQMLESTLTGLARGAPFELSSLAVLSLAGLLGLLITLYQITLILQAILSWVAPATYNPVSELLYALNEPLLRPARRYIPAVSGIDLSPLAVLILLQLLKFLMIAPLVDFGLRLG